MQAPCTVTKRQSKPGANPGVCGRVAPSPWNGRCSEGLRPHLAAVIIQAHSVLGTIELGCPNHSKQYFCVGMVAHPVSKRRHLISVEAEYTGSPGSRAYLGLISYLGLTLEMDSASTVVEQAKHMGHLDPQVWSRQTS